jgi:hypothetical protein
VVEFNFWEVSPPKSKGLSTCIGEDDRDKVRRSPAASGKSVL